MQLPEFSRKSLGFIMALSGLCILLFHATITPVITDYPFQTVTKFQGKYPNPIYLTFNWKSKDELMVGKQIAVSVDIRGLPYASNQTLKDIKMKFNGLNYFSNKLNDPNNRISTNDTLTFKSYGNEGVFRSDTIYIRYIVPEDESVELYDYNMNPNNMTIEKIIHPAPHDTFVQIDTARTTAGVSIAVLISTLIMIWSALSPKDHPTKPISPNTKNQKWMIAIFIISTFSAFVVDYFWKVLVGDLG